MSKDSVAVSTAKVRRDNLRKLIQQHGGPTALARKLGYKNAAFLVTVGGPNPTRSVTERNARSIESKLGLPSLDAVGANPAPEGSVSTELIRESVRCVAEHVNAVGVKLTPAKFADLVVFVYLDALDKGAPSDGVIQRAVQLAT